jgi:hypothetical protein
MVVAIRFHRRIVTVRLALRPIRARFGALQDAGSAERGGLAVRGLASRPRSASSGGMTIWTAAGALCQIPDRMTAATSIKNGTGG